MKRYGFWNLLYKKSSKIHIEILSYDRHCAKNCGSKIRRQVVLPLKNVKISVETTQTIHYYEVTAVV